MQGLSGDDLHARPVDGRRVRGQGSARLVTRVPSSASDEYGHDFDAEAQLLARALRAGRLTVLVGASGVGKTTLLGAACCRCCATASATSGRSRAARRRWWSRCPTDAVALRAAARANGFTSSTSGPRHRWNRWCARSTNRRRPRESASTSPKPCRPRTCLPSADGTAGRVCCSCSIISNCCSNARSTAPTCSGSSMRGPAVVQAPDLDAHFLVAVDDHAWPRLQALCTRMPDVELHAFRLQARSGRRVLESLTDHQPGDGAADDRVAVADFEDSLNAMMSGGRSRCVRQNRRPGLAASLNAICRGWRSRCARQSPRSGDFAASLNGMRVAGVQLGAPGRSVTVGRAESGERAGLSPRARTPAWCVAWCRGGAGVGGRRSVHASGMRRRKKRRGRPPRPKPNAKRTPGGVPRRSARDEAVARAAEARRAAAKAAEAARTGAAAGAKRSRGRSAPAEGGKAQVRRRRSRQPPRSGASRRGGNEGAEPGTRRGRAARRRRAERQGCPAGRVRTVGRGSLPKPSVRPRHGSAGRAPGRAATRPRAEGSPRQEGC